MLFSMQDNAPEPSQATPEVETPAAKPAAPTNAKDLRAKLAADLAAKRSKESAKDDDSDDDDEKPAPKKAKPPEEPKPAPAIEKKIEAKEVRLEAAGVSVPDQKKGETDAAYDLRLAKLLRENEELKGEVKKGEITAKELARFKKLIDDGKANPLTVLDALGMDFETLVKGLNPQSSSYKKDWVAPGKKAELPAELLEEIAALKADRQEREAAKLRTAAQAQQAEDTGKVEKFLEANSDDFPFLSSVPWGAQEAIQQAYKNKATDVLPILRQLEETLSDNAEKLISSDKALKAAVKKNPGLKDLLKKLFADEAPAAKPKKGDDEVTIEGLSDLVAEPPARSTRRTREEERADLVAALKAKRRKAAESDED